MGDHGALSGYRRFIMSSPKIHGLTEINRSRYLKSSIRAKLKYFVNFESKTFSDAYRRSSQFLNPFRIFI